MGSAPGSALGVEDSGLLSPQSESAGEAEKAGPPHSSFQTDHLEENFAGKWSRWISLQESVNVAAFRQREMRTIPLDGH